MTFRLPHLLAAIALHVVLITLLVSGVQCSMKPTRPPVISAVLLDPSRQEAARQKRDELKRQQERERQRKEEEARQKQVAEQKQRQAEQERKAKADALALKKKQDEAKRQKEAADKKKTDEQARRKQAQEEQREREVATKRELEQKLRMEQALQEESRTRELEREQAARAASEREVKTAQWADALVRHVQQNYQTPPGAPPDFTCQVHMQLLPDGTVTNAKIVKSCGSAPLDRAVEDAVYRSSPMPRPADPSVFDRDLTINFEP